jgi:esterase/lipase
MKPSSLWVVFAVFIISTPLYAQGKTGVVLMHGKQGTASYKSPIGTLADYLKSNDILVVTPDMPWHRNRYLEKTYDDSMKEIDEAVEKLRSEGATTIVVGGHSMGANAAMGYGARREGIAGILAIAPGHVPDLGAYQDRIDNDWERAKEMVDSGKADDISEFKDRNQGKNFELSTSAAIYLSWFEPLGPASMATNVSNLKPDTALFWIVGEKDRMYDRGEEYAFSSTPSHPKNEYVVVKGGHKATPKKGKKQILEWLRNL